MIDLGISKLALIGAVALVVIGPEKLPRVARTVGALLGKAQRYVAEVKAEVNRTMDLEELRKMKESVEGAARDVESSFQKETTDFEKSWSEATSGLDAYAADGIEPQSSEALSSLGQQIQSGYRHPKKNWRIKQGAMPKWYKMRHGVRTRVLSGAARVARYRPKGVSLSR